MSENSAKKILVDTVSPPKSPQDNPDSDPLSLNGHIHRDLPSTGSERPSRQSARRNSFVAKATRSDEAVDQQKNLQSDCQQLPVRQPADTTHLSLPATRTAARRSTTGEKSLALLAARGKRYFSSIADLKADLEVILEKQRAKGNAALSAWVMFSQLRRNQMAREGSRVPSKKRVSLIK